MAPYYWIKMVLRETDTFLGGYLIVIGICSNVFVVRAEDQVLHDAFHAWVDVSCKIARRKVPCDEFVGHGDDVPVVRCQAEPKHCELMPLQ